MKAKTVAGVINKKVIPNVLAEVLQVGKNDYRVVISGIGEHSKHHQMSPAISKARWLSDLNQEDLNHEIAKVQCANDGVSSSKVRGRAGPG